MPTHSFKTILLATDQQRSVLSALHTNRPHPIAYPPYGHRPRENGGCNLLGFNGEPSDPLTGHYHLGNGYRQFNPVLMRFNSTDRWSPFGKGGLNAYAYCGGDPVNRSDPTGHMWKSFKIKFRENIRVRAVKTQKPASINVDNSTNVSALADFSTQTSINGRNESVPINYPMKNTSTPIGRTPTVHSNDGNLSKYPPARTQFENYLDSALGSANSASLDELIINHAWLRENPGPSRLIEKVEYTLAKIRKNIDKRLSQNEQ
ncbi:RHS repeat-associated core domain-containing protein [Pseudomonas sp. Irchel 3A7]|uniref:RHS repeat-associated core domain-containing protein n=1 Tax=Pseudomonas sp. Irchel 3A7 TaxID=2008913 RepID=UPI000BA41D74